MNEPAQAALERFDHLRDEFSLLVEGMPAAAVEFRRAGDDYPLGGLVPHVAIWLDHYARVLEQVEAAGFGQVTAEPSPDDPRVKAGIAAGDIGAALTEMREAHSRLRVRLAAHAGEWERKAPVDYGGGTPYPTAPADLADWMIDHYREYIPQVAALLGEWKALEAVSRFNEAFNAHDVDAVMALMTEDVVFDNTYPPPDGERFTGRTAVRAYWERFFAESPNAHFDAEEMFGDATRVTVRWRFDWGDGHVRGVDVIRVRDGRLAEKFSYVKG